ncbi:MAG TPA: HAD family hydrolase [Sphingomonas sp.]|jgi:FMN phosphatase YigB (HAD superfamily)|nr:HAD family hydrolase [Sphingomonas sp.]
MSTILPHELASVLDEHKKLRVLSLDCFDTLLWRDVHRPGDIFPLMGTVDAAQRGYAEARARKTRMLFDRECGEVTLREIYTAYDASADEATVEAWVDAEIETEARHCYAFAPVVELMREAKRRGLKIIVVSDTYLERDQLERLIRGAAGDEVVDMIDTIFCSSVYRAPKGGKLFDHVLADIRVRPNRILHIGDNPHADFHAAVHHGLHARHLIQFDEVTVQRLRQEAAMSAVLQGQGPAFQPHRAALAVEMPQIEDPGEALGFAVLGPVMTGFAGWIADEAQALQKKNGGTVHTLFLMRDGHLPALVAEAFDPDVRAHRVEISRFTSQAASLSTRVGRETFALEEIGDGSGHGFLKQMLLTEEESEEFLLDRPRVNRGHWVFENVLTGRWSDLIAARADAFVDRMIAYLRSVVNPAAGDTLMLVDLGYNGSVQNRIEGFLRERMNVHVAGRYLLLRESQSVGLDKVGMIGRQDYDDGTLVALFRAVAILEQLCSVEQGSVVDYAEGGPVRNDAGLKSTQIEMRTRVQRGAVRFAKSHRNAVVRATDEARITTWRQGAFAALGRFLLLPRPAELALFTGFRHDVNLGTKYTVGLFDPEAAARGLRRGGLSYMQGSRNMYLPAELSGQGFALSMTNVVRQRFGIDMRYVDFCDSEIVVPLLIVEGKNAFRDTVTAYPTHDGYYVAAVPVGNYKFTVGLQFGQLYEWVQIDSTSFLPVAAFLRGDATVTHYSIEAKPSLEGIEQTGDGVFRCDPTGFVMVPPPGPIPEHGPPMMLNIVFRPLVKRATAALPALQPQIVEEVSR